MINNKKMSFIIQENIVYVNTKLTSIGRKLLASGLLNFSKFAFGDSEIDYTFSKDTEFDMRNSVILRPKDNNPNIKYFIQKTSNSTDNYSTITAIAPVETKLVNTAKERGFFTGNTTSGFTLLTASTFLRQGTAIINISGVTGGTSVSIKQSSSFSGFTEPAIGDYVLINWLNPDLSGVTLNNGVISANTPTPSLMYKIESKTGDLLSTNNLVVTLDRNIPNFNDSTSTSKANVYFFPSGNSILNFYGSGSTIPYWNEATLSFDSTCNLSNDDVKVWNMNIVYTEGMAGVDGSTYETIGDYGSSGYTGFKNFVGNTYDKTTQKALGIIHYTNNSISNYYGEALYSSTPVLELPTIMYHDNTGSTLGLTISCDTTKQTTITGTSALTTTYYNLVDEFGGIVGKCFNDLKLFVIEDEEILSAMSYKSNRNWTLPQLLNQNTTTPLTTEANLISSTQDLYVTYMFANSGSYTAGTNNGYSTGLHCNKYLKVTTNDTSKGVAQFSIDSSDLRFLNMTGGTGFSADKFYILTQRVSKNQRPTTNGWKIYDYTNLLNNYTNWSGSTIPSSAFTGQIYRIDANIYNGSTTYNLNDFITIPTLGNPDKLQFGDEVFFLGNIKTDITATVFKTKFTLNLPFNEFNTTSNPTWSDTQSVYIDEIGIYSSDNSLVAVGKLSYPLEKKSSQTRIIELSIDF
jgi:hypothetical protein